VLSLPILFTAGMSLMDTTDGVAMCKAYDWAFVNPLRKIYYNITTTTLSVAVALVIGTVELIQVLTHMLDLNGAFFNFFAHLEFHYLGYIIVGLFILTWGISMGVWKWGHIERRYAGMIHSHKHTHKDGTTHEHPHIHPGDEA
jgi:high-affinity nickel-transport protein